MQVSSPLMVVAQVTNQIAIHIMEVSEGSTETNSQSCQTFKMKHFVKTVLWNIFVNYFCERSILDVW